MIYNRALLQNALEQAAIRIIKTLGLDQFAVKVERHRSYYTVTITNNWTVSL